MSIMLSGLFQASDGRDCAVLQDDTERDASGAVVVRVRVMRQQDPDVQEGTLVVPGDVWTAAGPGDAERSSNLAQSLIWWLQDRPGQMTFKLLASVSYGLLNSPRLELQELAGVRL